MVCFYASKIYPILLDFVLYGNTCSEEHLYLKKLALIRICLQVIRNNLFLEKVCRVNLNFPKSVCDDIQGHDDKQVTFNFLCKFLSMLNMII